MADKQEPTMTLPPVGQIGIVVQDVEKVAAYYHDVFGWGPFQIMEVDLSESTYNGKKSNGRLKVAFAQSGPVEIELIQVLEGQMPHSDFLSQKGEGLQHLRFQVDDLDAVLADLAKRDIHPIWYWSLPEMGMKFTYIDSDKIGGVMFELFEMKQPPG